jgi:hypothetical protein
MPQRQHAHMHVHIYTHTYVDTRTCRKGAHHDTDLGPRLTCACVLYDEYKAVVPEAVDGTFAAGCCTRLLLGSNACCCCTWSPLASLYDCRRAVVVVCLYVYERLFVS